MSKFSDNERKKISSNGAEKSDKKGYHKRANDSAKKGYHKKSDNAHKREYQNKEDNSGKKGYRNKVSSADNGEFTKKKSICPVSGRCGGCSMIDEPYNEQLTKKEAMVRKLLNPYVKTDKIIGMENPMHYRNKVHAVFAHKKDGTIVSGVYKEGTHIVVPVEKCLIENELADEIIGTIRGMLKSFKIKTYNEDTGYGFLRHVLVRTGHESGQVMVVLVVASNVFPSRNNFIKALLKAHPQITTVVMNYNDKNTSMVLGEKERVLYGKGYIEDTLCGCRFRISSKSFYQVNSIQTEKLYNLAIDYAGLSGNEIVFDAYCGIGTIGIIASKKAGKVIGVELNKDAVRDAVRNAKVNSIGNIDFYNNDAGKFMAQYASEGASADVVFMDPPRAGSDELFMENMLTLMPKKIVYISCNPVTLARDLKYLTGRGYEVMKATPVDMFPCTEHVEVVCCLHRVNS